MPVFHVDQQTRKRSQALRKNMNEPEKCLWFRLNRRQVGGYKFRRQYPVSPYIVDFVCLEKRLIIEVDGESHDINAGKDMVRTKHLEREGFCVMRFLNGEVMENVDGVLMAIAERLAAPTPALPRKRGREGI